jgi:hypothetical protein
VDDPTIINADNEDDIVIYDDDNDDGDNDDDDNDGIISVEVIQRNDEGERKGTQPVAVNNTDKYK